MPEQEVSQTLNQPTSNKSKRFIVVIVVVIILLAVGIFAFIRNQIDTQPTANLPQEVSVELTNDGFIPETVTIKRGGAVRWANNSTDEKVSVNSDDHPTNQKYPELNLGEIPKGSTVMHIFSQPGEYTYHDYFHPERKGTVIVE